MKTRSLSTPLSRILFFLALLSSAPSSAQTITDLPDAPVTPSGRLRIMGTGFGSSGSVTIDGVQALTSIWRQDEVHAYVPEGTRIGTAQVQLTNTNGTSNSVAFEVVARQADGRVRWRLAISSVLPNSHGIGVGPEGMIYTDDSDGRLYAIRPDGALAWIYEGNDGVVGGGVEGPVDVGPDAFYVAFNEGNVPGVSFNYLFGFEFDGSQRFAVPGAAQTGRPHARDDGSMVLRWGISSLIRSVDAFGNEQWTLGLGNNLTEPVVGSDGVTYQQVGSGDPKLHAIDPAGSTLWTVEGTQLGWMNFMGVRPDGGQLLDGGRANFGEPGWIRAYDTLDGALQWNIALPEEDPGSGLADLIVQSEWSFGGDPSQAYVMVNALVFDTDDAYGYVYAIDVGEGGEIVSDCFGASDCPCANPDPSAGCANSNGQGALLSVAAGGPSVTADDLVLSASGLPVNQSALLYMGPASISLPFGDGLRCVGAASIGLFRFPIRNAGTAGEIHEGPGIVAHSQAGFGPGAIDAGERWRFQCWYRDPGGPCGETFNLSNVVEVQFVD